MAGQSTNQVSNWWDAFERADDPRVPRRPRPQRRPLPPPALPFSYFEITNPVKPDEDEHGPNPNQVRKIHLDPVYGVVQESESIGYLKWLFGTREQRHSSQELVTAALRGDLYRWNPYFLGYGQTSPYARAIIQGCNPSFKNGRIGASTSKRK